MSKYVYIIYIKYSTKVSKIPANFEKNLQTGIASQRSWVMIRVGSAFCNASPS